MIPESYFFYWVMARLWPYSEILTVHSSVPGTLEMLTLASFLHMLCEDCWTLFRILSFNHRHDFVAGTCLFLISFYFLSKPFFDWVFFNWKCCSLLAYGCRSISLCFPWNQMHVSHFDERKQVSSIICYYMCTVYCRNWTQDKHEVVTMSNE